ncbi:hypothetical protein L1I30_01940 [Gillisia sp. M10.2A]|uniref:TonB C-terminal domain-containing protein n=1 Tax=Gillisia lutea TaxID=2909668 RepID=A0ABS9EBZ5_9FLAO|nr:hypothetical protein [Gillisia lutea]MCF4100416.1 hypothetical protein [Gillisia lutea]
MDFFDKHKALIITLLFFAVLLLGLYNFNLSNNNRKTRELLVDLESFKTEEPIQEAPKAEENVAKPKAVKTHQAFNENQETRETNFDQQLNEIFEKNSASQSESTPSENSGASGDYTLQKATKKPQQKRSDGNNAAKITSTKSGGIDNSSISFSLKDRTAINIPNPIYTCDVAGKIVINISVNEEGRVIKTAINKGSSTSQNECLTEQALEYASQAIFSRLAGRNNQPGTITYQFKP